MSQHVFEIDGATARAGPLSAGPWNPGLQHGGAPTALIVRTAEQIPAPTPMHVARVTVDLLRPVPVGEIAVESEVVRQGRKIQLLQVRLFAGGVEVTRGSVLKVRTEAVEPPAAAAMPNVPGPEGLPIPPMPNGGDEVFGANFEMRAVQGGFRQAGPGAVWFRLKRPLVAGEPTSPSMFAAAVSDFSNGISSVLPFDEWTFINGDLTVNFARVPEGEWILSDAETWIGPDGGGLAMTRLADRRGWFGRATQSLVVEKR